MNRRATHAYNGCGSDTIDNAQQMVKSIQVKEVHAHNVTTIERGWRLQTHCALPSSTAMLGRLRLGVKILRIGRTSCERCAAAADSVSSKQQFEQKCAEQSPCASTAAMVVVGATL